MFLSNFDIHARCRPCLYHFQKFENLKNFYFYFSSPVDDFIKKFFRAKFEKSHRSTTVRYRALQFLLLFAQLLGGREANLPFWLFLSGVGLHLACKVLFWTVAGWSCSKLLDSELFQKTLQRVKFWGKNDLPALTIFLKIFQKFSKFFQNFLKIFAIFAKSRR